MQKDLCVKKVYQVGKIKRFTYRFYKVREIEQKKNHTTGADISKLF